MADNFTYTWESLSEKDAATVKRCFGPNGTQELVRFFVFAINEITHIVLRSKPELMRANPSIKQQCSRVRNIKVVNFCILL